MLKFERSYYFLSMAFEFIIIGAGVAGATAFHYLSKIAPTLLLEEKNQETHFDSVRIIVGHAHQYLPPEIPLTDPSIFLRPVNTIINVSRQKEARIPGQTEFGKPFGWVINEQNFIHWCLQAGEKSGGKIVWQSKVTHIEYTPSEVIVTVDSTSYHGKLLLLATGAYAPELNRDAGFGLPDQLNTLSTNFYASPEVFDRIFPGDYFYLLHPQMSARGPFQMTRGQTFATAIYVSDESYDVMKDKFLRILRNYAWLQPILKEMQNPPAAITEKNIRFGKVWKHPIAFFSTNRAIILGEASGIVTECYYEGLLNCLASAHFAQKVITDLYHHNQEYSLENLKLYDGMIRESLLNNFHLSQKGSEGMFLSPGQYQSVIWDAYLDAINSDKKVRQYIWLAWVDPDITHYPLDHDEYCGERIYMNIPLGNRLLLTPYFLKLKFSSPSK